MNHKHRKNLIIALGLLMSAIIVALQAQSTVHAVPNQEAFVNPIHNAKPGSESSQPASATLEETAVLYPDTLDPPASCGVPLHAPFGQDVEILISEGPDDPMYQLSLNPGWHDQQWLPKDNSAPIEDIVAVAQGTEKIVAAWVEPGEGLRFETWDSSNGWSGVFNLEQYPDSSPALLSRNAYNWVIFTRVGHNIYYREWNNGVLGEWEALPGVTGDAAAASDPVVISKDPNHMAVFYHDASGAVWFTEGVLGGEETADLSIRASTQVTNTLWREKPVSLSGIEDDFDIYLPLVINNTSASSFVRRDIISPITGTPNLAAEDIFTLASELSVVSRNENHLAVFGVDADNQLWVNEWTNRNASDWHDTEWVKLMENVTVERPSVTSRHSNHLGLAVRDTSGEPWYLEWTYAGGWKPPVSLGGTRNNPLTIAAPRLDSLSVFTVEAGEIWHKEWTEEQSWGHWLLFTDTNAQNGQILVAAARQMDDLMLLGRRNDGDGFYKHFTSLDQGLLEEVVTPGSPGWSPKTLAMVDGTTLMAAGRGTYPGIWEIVAMALSNGITETLQLPDHPEWGESSSGALGADDLDFDGSDEVVIATTTAITDDINISVVDFSMSSSLAITLTSTITYAVPEGSHSVVNDVAIGDLDGDGRQDEVALTYRTDSDWHVIVFEYITSTNTLEYREHKVFPAPGPGYSMGNIRTAIGKVFDRHPNHGKLSSEHLIVSAVNRAPYSSPDLPYVHTEVYSMTLTSPGEWSFLNLDAIDDSYSVSDPNTRHISLSTGDLNADGLEEIVYTRIGAVQVIGYNRDGNRTIEASHPAYYGIWSSSKFRHAVGDFDQDGKAEIAYWATGDQVAILDLVDEHTLQQSSSITPTLFYGELFSGDLDGDSFQAELAGCSDFSEISVIAVLNGAPRLYAGGLPVQDTDVRYAKTASGGSSSAWGTATNLGGFVSVGFEVEINVPIIGTKLGEVRGSVTQDFMASQGQTQTVEESVTLSSGYNNAIGQTLGIVVYNGTDYRCYYYDVYAPATPAQTSRAMICQPQGNAYEHFRSLEQWHSTSFKQQAGASWVDVGHRTAGGVHTNEVNTYPSGLPVDPYLLKHTWDPNQPFRVDYDVSGGYTDWSITQMGGGARETSQSFETNTTTSVGATVGNVTLDAGFTFGFGWDKSRAVSWSNELEIGGSVYLNSDPAFANCVYTVVPYIYHAKATSQAGATYPYLEMDYYVPSLTGNCSPLSSAQTMESLFMDRPEPE